MLSPFHFTGSLNQWNSLRVHLGVNIILVTWLVMWHLVSLLWFCKVSLPQCMLWQTFKHSYHYLQQGMRRQWLGHWVETALPCSVVHAAKCLLHSSVQNFRFFQDCLGSRCGVKKNCLDVLPVELLPT